MDLHTVIYVYTLYMYACTHVHMYMLRTDLKPLGAEVDRYIHMYMMRTLTCTYVLHIFAIVRSSCAC